MVQVPFGVHSPLAFESLSTSVIERGRLFEVGLAAAGAGAGAGCCVAF